VAKPDDNNKIVYRRYLVAITGSCHCHSKKLLQTDFIIPENSAGYRQGGVKLKGHDGKKIYGPNLTPDTVTGIGAYSREDFSEAVRAGIVPGGTPLKPPIPEFKQPTDTQVHAIYAYVMSLPAVHQTIKKSTE